MSMTANQSFSLRSHISRLGVYFESFIFFFRLIYCTVESQLSFYSVGAPLRVSVMFSGKINRAPNEVLYQGMFKLY